MPERVRVQIEGEDELMDFLRRLDVDGLKEIKAAVRARTSAWAENARRLTPDDPKTPGLLKESVSIILPGTRNRQITGGIKAGGSVLEARMGKRGYSAWAIVQHDDLTLHHPAGGQAKFLEIPFMRGVAEIPDLILDAMDRVKP